jgi:hypothetical protein
MKYTMERNKDYMKETTKNNKKESRIAYNTNYMTAQMTDVVQGEIR